MIYITQVIYIKDGKEDVFNEFEAIAIPLLKKYNGQLLLRVRPDTDSIIEAAIDKLYGITHSTIFLNITL